jgi:hypothetical protein
VRRKGRKILKVNHLNGIGTWLIWEISWPAEDGSTSFRSFLVIVFLALVWARGAAVFKARLHLEADLEGSD